MHYLPITDKQVRTLIEDYIAEMTNTETMEKLVYKMLTHFRAFDGADWTRIKKFVDRQHTLQLEENDDMDSTTHITVGEWVNNKGVIL